jgi:hypothetical protein
MIASSPDSKSTSPPITQNISFSNYEKFEDGLLVVLDGAPYF